jgi:hypothetical protein
MIKFGRLLNLQLLFFKFILSRHIDDTYIARKRPLRFYYFIIQSIEKTSFRMKKKINGFF